MSNSFIPSLQTLPVEILHHILDQIDAQTILLSFRNTCRQFRAVVNSYDRYVLDFQSISKPDFHLVCHLIDPNRVTSLILSETSETYDQIKLFLSRLQLQQFNRLHSLSLFISEEEQLKNLLGRFNIHLLQSFSLKLHKWDDRRKTTTARLLSSIIAKSNLFKLELHMQEGRFDKIIWPTECSIRSLSINNFVAFNEIVTILQRSPHLQTLVINSILILHSNQVVPTSFEHLKSLTMNKVNMNIDDLEFFLSMTPSLLHLKLIGHGNYSNGNRWEHFIRSHLFLLKQFQFFFTETQTTLRNLSDLNQIITLFQTPFWLEDKKWSVVCEMAHRMLGYITLYSTPVCVTDLSYETEKISISNYPEYNDGNFSMMDNVDTVRFDFTRLLPLNMKKEGDKTNYPLFRKVKRLELQFDAIRSFGWIESVTLLIDLKSVIHVKISSSLIRQSSPSMLSDMKKFFQKIPHVSSVDINFGFLSRRSSLTAIDICSMLPPHVKHLAVSIKDLSEIKSTFQRLEHLSSANFFYDYTPNWNEMTRWFEDNRKGSSYQVDSFSACVWLGKNITSSTEIKIGNKRVKLADEHHQS